MVYDCLCFLVVVGDFRGTLEHIWFVGDVYLLELGNTVDEDLFRRST